MMDREKVVNAATRSPALFTFECGEHPLPLKSETSTIKTSNRFAVAAVIIVGLFSLLSAGHSAYAQDISTAFDVPRHSRGIAWAWDKLWIGGIAERGEWIWGYDPDSGTLIDSIPAPVPDCLSLEGHQNGLVYLSSRSDSTYIITGQGAKGFRSPFRRFGGLGSDGDNLWGATYFEPQATLFQMDLSGRILFHVPFGGTQSRDMAFLKNRLYIADQLTQNIRVVDPVTGRLIGNIVPPGRNPSGVTSDGKGIWFLDEGDSKPTDQVYHLNVRPEGGIRFSALHHNYGSVVENEERNWTVWIYNDGPRSTRLISFQAREGNDEIFRPHVWNFPETIQAGDSIGLTITFSPAYQDSVRISFAFTYDMDNIENIVDLRGKGVRRQRNIVIPERNLAFGQCYFGEGSRNSNLRHLIIENAGGEPLTVREIRFTNGAFLTGGIEFPHTFVHPGAYRIPVFFRPGIPGQVQATGTIVSDDPDSPEINFSLSGEGRYFSYPGGTPIWNITTGNSQNAIPRIRAIQPLDDISGDDLADVVVASNDYIISCYHGASTLTSTPFWTYYTNANPWRSGLVTSQKAIAEGSDWDADGRNDLVFGLDGGALSIVALSGNVGQEIWEIDTHGLPGYGGIPVTVIASDDFTGDHFNDVIVVTKAKDENHTTRSIFMIDGRAARVAWFTELPADPLDVANLEDVSGDGVNDLLVVTIDGGIYGYDGRGGNRLFDDRIEGTVRSVAAVPDVNRDGSMDVCIATYGHGLYMVNGSNGADIWHRRGPNEVILMITNGDLNRNGSTDLIYATIRSYFMAIEGTTGENIWHEPFLVGSQPLSLAHIEDLNRDGLDDYLVGTLEGRLYCLSGNGRDALWSYSNVNEGHGFELIVASRDIDGNGQMDIFAAMQRGTVYAFAGSFIGNNAVEIDPKGNPTSIILNPAYPNPFNSTVTIPFELNSAGNVTLSVFDATGREILNRNIGSMKAGSHRLLWNGSDFSSQPAGSGVYFVRVEANATSVVRQVQLIR